MEQAINMSIELSATFGPQLSQQSIARVKAHILACTRFVLGRESGADFGLIEAAGDSTGSGAELITVSITASRAYVAFHACNRSDREEFIDIINGSFTREGIRAELGEL